MVLLTGLGSNGAIDKEGKWKGKYIPSFLRRYPFTLVKTDASEETLHIGFDLESGLFSSPEGELLFDASGTPTEVLQDIKKLLTAFQQESQVTENILKILQEKELLEETQMAVNKDGEEQKVGGFFIVNKKKLLETEDDFLLDIVKNGWMEMIELHLLSLTTIKKLEL